MSGNFYNGAFFGGGFFGAITPTEETTPTGGKDDKGRKRLNVRRSDPFKPTGLIDRPKAKNVVVDDRLAEQVAVQADIAGKLAREFNDDYQPPVIEMTAQEIAAEIGILIRKKMRTEEDEVLLLLLLAASAAI